MYEYYKQYKRDHCLNFNDEYGETHHRSHLHGNPYLNPDFSTCSECGICGIGRMTSDIDCLMLEKEIQEVSTEFKDAKA